MNRKLAVGVSAFLMMGWAAAHAQPRPTTQAEADAQAEAEEAAKRAQQAREEKAKAPPAAIPGAEASGPIAPASKLAAEMSPNDALFDAINRGDQAAARDALNRGAQLDATNVLGQTPIEASTDLNRTDITFLLLSERGSIGGESRRTAAVQAALPSRPVPVRHRVRPAQVAVAARPADRGVPNPQVGFTGF